MDAIAGTATVAAEEALPDGVPQGLNGRLKRLIDLALAIPVIVFAAPLMAAIALGIKLQDGGPILFRHTRRGRGGSHFTLLKFRTMRMDADDHLKRLLADNEDARKEWNDISKLSSDPRVTWLGRFLRRSSLDELPQLFNIVRGQMSVVGPRPIIDQEYTRYGIYASAYAAARPGLTGLWQVSGRNKTDFETRIALDTAYVRDWTLGRDIVILLKTFPTVISGRGAY